MKIIACYSIYNEAENIIRSLNSVASFCDRIVILDGAFESYPHKFASGGSDDGTVELVREWLLQWKGEGFLALPRSPWPNQQFKRSSYFRFGDPGDWFFVIDGDEEVVDGQDEIHEFLTGIKPETDGILVREIIQKGEGREVVRWPGLAPRLIRFKPGLRYSETYRLIVNVETITEWPQFTMRHHRYDPIRSPIRRSTKAEYQTPELFAVGVGIGKPDGRKAGFQVRLIQWMSGLQYAGAINRIRIDDDYEFSLAADEHTLSSPLNICHLERHPAREDNPTDGPC